GTPNNDKLSNCIITTPGTTPLVTTSAKESNSNPTLLSTLSSLAKKPSKKSKNIPRNTNTAAVIISLLNAKNKAIHPHSKLRDVIKFGTCFFIHQLYLP